MNLNSFLDNLLDYIDFIINFFLQWTFSLKNFSWSHGVYHLFLSPMNFRSSSWRVLLDHLEFIIGVFFNLSFIFFLYAEFFSTAISIKQIKYDKKSFTFLEFVNWDSYPSFHFLFFLLGFFLRRFWFYSSIF